MMYVLGDLYLLGFVGVARTKSCSRKGTTCQRPCLTNKNAESIGTFQGACTPMRIIKSGRMYYAVAEPN